MQVYPINSTMDRKENWEQYRNELSRHNVTKLYHFTSRENIDSIKKNGGLYSWAECVRRGITVSKPGGSYESHEIDARKGLDEYVHLSFVKDHPMAYVAMEDRISNPYILEIDVEVAWWEGTLYSDRNAASSLARIGGELWNLRTIKYDVLGAWKMFDLTEALKPYYQAEVLVKDFIPIENIHIVDYINDRGDRYSPDRLTFLKPHLYGSYDVIVDEGTTSIKAGACSCLYGLESVTLPKSLITIGKDAFCKCCAMKDIELPENLESIGERAFFNCKELKSIVIPRNVKDIGGGAFNSNRCNIICESPYFTIIDGILYDAAMTRVICCLNNSAYNVVLPESVKRIENFAFYFSHIFSIKLGDQVEYIGDYAFSFCSNLGWIGSGINLPPSLKVIGYAAFAFSNYLHSVDIPEGVSVRKEPCS